MSRITLTYLIPILAPTAVYLLWFWWRGRVARANGGQPPAIERGPWVWLIGAGVALALGLTAVLALRPAQESHGTYVPAHVDAQGHLVPDHFE